MINNDMIEKDVYSTEEVKTNKVWIDGKPIYRKVAYFDNYTIKTGINYIPFDCPTIKDIVKIDLLFKYGGVKAYKQWDGYCTGNIILNDSLKSLEINNKQDPLTVHNLVIIAEYTKQ